MSELTATQIPKPSDEQAFERCMEILWRCILEDGNVKLHGRRGQSQRGVDLIGIRDGEPDQIVGVQCKLKGDGNTLGEAEVRAEVEKALTFEPLLSEYIIVTTAPDDANLDKLALELSISASKDRKINLKVQVLGWGSLEREIRRYPQALNAVDPSHSPSNKLFEQKMDDLSDLVAAAVTPKLANTQAAQAINPTVIDVNAHTVIERQINDYADLISNEPRTALVLLEKLQDSLNDNATDFIRFRVASNIATCQLELGEEETAAKGFIAAYDHDPGNPKAIANKAFGLFLQDGWPSLRAFAEPQLLEYPDNATLAAYYIQGLAFDRTVNDPLDRVSESVRGSPEVAEAHVRWLVGRGEPGAWWDVAISAYETHPENKALEELYANALLDRAIGGANVINARIFSEHERSDIETAISIYKARWPHLRDSACHSRDEALSIPVNLMVAYRILQLAQKAIEIGDEALARFSGNLTVMKHVAEALIEEGEFERAQTLVSELETDRETVMLLFNISLATKEWAAVLDLIDAHLEAFPEAERDLARAAGVYARVELESAEERHSILQAEQDVFQGDTRASILLAKVARINGFDELASTYFKSGQDAFQHGDDGFPSRFSIALEAMGRGQPHIAADMLTDHVSLDCDSDELCLLAHALAYDFPIRNRAKRFFENLAAEVRNLPFYQRLEGVFHINRGDPQAAVGPLAAAFEKQPSIDILMSLIIAHFMVDDRDAIAKLIQNCGVDSLPGPVLDRIKFGHVLLEFGESARALDLGYQAMTEGLDSADVVGMFIALVISFTQNRPRKLDGVVAPSVWVRLKPNHGEAHEVLLDEPADRPWGEKANSTNSFYSKSLGLKAGQEFKHVNRTTDMTETWTVVEVKPRWLQAFHQLIKSYGQRFPNANGFAYMTMAKGDIEPVLEQVRRRSEDLRVLADLYLVENLPIAFIAGDMPSGSIGFAEYLISIGEEVCVCVGSQDEMAEALGLIEDHGRCGAVLDALTAWRAAGLGVFPILKERLGSLAIPANEFGNIQNMIDGTFGETEREAVSLTYHEGKYNRHIITPESQVERLKMIRSRLADIREACTIEPVVIPDNLTEAGESLLGLWSGNAVAPSLIAGQDRLLLCEDMMMRHLVGSVFGSKSIWLQPVLLSALEAGTTTLSAYSDALVQLAAHRHGFVPIRADVLRSVFERDMSPELVQLQALCAYLGNKNAEPYSHLRIAADFINAIWAGAPSHDVKVMAATGVVLRVLLFRNRGKEWARWGGWLVLRLGRAPKEYFTKWCEGHFHPIVDVEMVLRKP